MSELSPVERFKIAQAAFQEHLEAVVAEAKNASAAAVDDFDGEVVGYQPVAMDQPGIIGDDTDLGGYVSMMPEMPDQMQPAELPVRAAAPTFAPASEQGIVELFTAANIPAPPPKKPVIAPVTLDNAKLQPLLAKYQVPAEVVEEHEKAFPMNGDFDTYWKPIAGKAAIMWCGKQVPGLATLDAVLQGVFVRPLVDLKNRQVKGVMACPLFSRLRGHTWTLQRMKRIVLYTYPPQNNPLEWPDFPREVYLKAHAAMRIMRAKDPAIVNAESSNTFPAVYALLESPQFTSYWAEVNNGGADPYAQQKHLRILRKGAVEKFLVPYRWTTGGRPATLLTHPATVLDVGTGPLGALQVTDAYGVKIRVQL